MQKVYENMNKYGEEMRGKFSYKPHGNGIVISVTSPFIAEIHIKSDDNIHRNYWETYSLLPPQQIILKERIGKFTITQKNNATIGVNGNPKTLNWKNPNGICVDYDG